ncbi:23S rRNA (uracil(1939)-C(5))-methyltransferase RlmD [Myxococcota bacterium]|nr:23S rRNA (uracil(1939)-C(5))-methyltransferase RlmD [Myxococcota bacterium]
MPVGAVARHGKQRPPVQVLLDRLEAKGLSGLDEAGRRHEVRAGAVGQAVLARRGRKGKAEVLEERAPAPDQVAPACPVYGLCGGCQLQAMPLARQRAEKALLVERLVGHPCQGCEGADGPVDQGAYGYRNKLELSWSPRRYTPAPPQDPAELRGSWLGFHPPGWFSRVVDVPSCPLGSPAMNRAIAAIRALALGPAWDNESHGGWWRHLVLREGDQGLLVTLVTHSSCPEPELRRAADALAALPEVHGVLWRVNDGVAEVATGALRAVLHGSPELQVTVGGTTLDLPPEAFFQVNSAGAAVLFDRIGAALGEGGTLLDLYCGVGAIGLHLGRRFDHVVGIELLDSAVEVARANAARLGLSGAWYAGPVEEILPTLDLPDPRRVVVDPPRVGLHPRAAAFLAGLDAEVLVYVACNPASLGRDRAVLEAGGWRLRDLWAVDLFPQTRHVEAVGRFLRG